MTDREANEARIAEGAAFLAAVTKEVKRVIVGQESLIERMLMGLLAEGHVLLEGVPGLAKSLAVQALAESFGGVHRRIQFTPDILPSDLLGTQIYNPKTGDWIFREGPVFANIVLADEINRASAKVQSALLEAMQEREVSLGGETRRLQRPFCVLATQNPLEQEGTYPLPEAQLDRFLLKVVVGYPDRHEEKEIIGRMARNANKPTVQQVASLDDLMGAQDLLDSVYMDDRLVNYIVDLVFATRDPGDSGMKDAEHLIAHGISPRGSIALTQASRAFALIHGRSFVTPQDVKSVAMDVFRHRIIVTYEAEAEGVSPEDLIAQLLDTIPVP